MNLGRFSTTLTIFSRTIAHQKISQVSDLAPLGLLVFFKFCMHAAHEVLVKPFIFKVRDQKLKVK